MKESMDLNNVGLWNIYYKILMYENVCVEKSNGSCETECSSNCPNQCNYDCTTIDGSTHECNYGHCVRNVMHWVESYESQLSTESISLRVVPECTNTMYN